MFCNNGGPIRIVDMFTLSSRRLKKIFFSFATWQIKHYLPPHSYLRTALILCCDHQLPSLTNLLWPAEPPSGHYRKHYSPELFYHRASQIPACSISWAETWIAGPGSQRSESTDVELSSVCWISKVSRWYSRAELLVWESYFENHCFTIMFFLLRVTYAILWFSIISLTRGQLISHLRSVSFWHEHRIFHVTAFL